MGSPAETGVFWPFKSLLQGAGIQLVETATSIQIVATGGGTGGGGGDMLQSEYAPSGVPGVVDHAKLADTATQTNFATTAGSVPWTGVTGTPTAFPTSWAYISNKPASFLPSAHALTHITGGSDVIPPATTTASGLVPPISGKATDWLGGDLVCHDLTNIHFPITFYAGVSMTGGALTTTGTTVNLMGMPGWMTVNSSGGYPGISFAVGPNGTNDATALYRNAGIQDLNETYYDTTGTQQWTGTVVNTYNPSGYYTFRAGTILVGVNDLPGDNTAWSLAPFRASSNSNGGFCGYGMVSAGYWGCCLGAWQSGLWIATSAQTFVQLTDTNGNIPFSALQASGTITGNLTVLGQTVVNGPCYLGWSGQPVYTGAGVGVGANLSVGTYLTVAQNSDFAGQGVFRQECGVGAGSWSQAPLRVQTAGANSRPGIAFWDEPRNAIYLYWDGAANALRYITSGGTVHQFALSF